VIAALLIIVAGLYVAYSAAVPASTRATILLMIAVQQVFMIVRSGLRVAHLGAEVDYYRQVRAMAPVGVAPPAAGPPASEPAPPPVEISTEPPARGAAKPGGNGSAEGQAQ
jgi:hypothetical protein